jgi:hypothetical protein
VGECTSDDSFIKKESVGRTERSQEESERVFYVVWNGGYLNGGSNTSFFLLFCSERHHRNDVASLKKYDKKQHVTVRCNVQLYEE